MRPQGRDRCPIASKRGKGPQGGNRGIPLPLVGVKGPRGGNRGIPLLLEKESGLQERYLGPCKKKRCCRGEGEVHNQVPSFRNRSASR